MKKSASKNATADSKAAPKVTRKRSTTPKTEAATSSPVSTETEPVSGPTPPQNTVPTESAPVIPAPAVITATAPEASGFGGFEEAKPLSPAAHQWVYTRDAIPGTGYAPIRMLGKWVIEQLFILLGRPLEPTEVKHIFKADGPMIEDQKGLWQPVTFWKNVPWGLEEHLAQGKKLTEFEHDPRYVGGSFFYREIFDDNRPTGQFEIVGFRGSRFCDAEYEAWARDSRYFMAVDALTRQRMEKKLGRGISNPEWIRMMDDRRVRLEWGVPYVVFQLIHERREKRLEERRQDREEVRGMFPSYFDRSKRAGRSGRGRDRLQTSRAADDQASPEDIELYRAENSKLGPPQIRTIEWKPGATNSTGNGSH